MKDWVVAFDEELEVFYVIGKDKYLALETIPVSIGSFNDVNAATEMAARFNNEES